MYFSNHYTNLKRFSIELYEISIHDCFGNCQNSVNVHNMVLFKYRHSFLNIPLFVHGQYGFILKVVHICCGHIHVKAFV